MFFDITDNSLLNVCGNVHRFCLIKSVKVRYKVYFVRNNGLFPHKKRSSLLLNASVSFSRGVVKIK